MATTEAQITAGQATFVNSLVTVGKTVASAALPTAAQTQAVQPTTTTLVVGCADRKQILTLAVANDTTVTLWRLTSGVD